MTDGQDHVLSQADALTKKGDDVLGIDISLGALAQSLHCRQGQYTFDAKLGIWKF